MKLTEQTSGWLPTKIHGEIAFPDGSDIEGVIREALRKLMTPSQIPNFIEIRYMIKTHEVTAAPTMKMKLSTQIKETKTLYFELD